MARPSKILARSCQGISEGSGSSPVSRDTRVHLLGSRVHSVRSQRRGKDEGEDEGHCAEVSSGCHRDTREGLGQVRSPAAKCAFLTAGTKV